MSDPQAQILTNVKTAFQALDPQLPIALFPVRLQVRFATPDMVAALPGGAVPEDLTGDPPAELWVRIYPDDIFVHAHENRLNEEEFAAAQSYWDALWESVQAREMGTPRQATREGAWNALVQDFGAVRARWVRQQTTPISGVDAEGFPAATPQLPALDLTSEVWNEAPRTYLLPDRFVVRLERNGAVQEYAGNLIEKQDDALILGIDPSRDDEFSDTPTGRNVPEEIRWMTDFRRAVEIGMGVRIPLQEEEQAGFDRMYVLGWLSRPDAAASVALLQSLFENHRYKVGGMDLVAPGMATNNTREQTVTRGPDERSAEETLALDEEADGDDPVRLAQALGLPADTFSGLDHSQHSSIQAGLAIHELLFDATLWQALSFWQKDLSAATRQKLLEYMSGWVSGRGLLPALRIDDQPYSFLPALPFSILKTQPAIVEDDFLRKLWADILTPLDDWYEQQLDRVPHIHRDLAAADLQTTLLSILQLHPHSVAYRQRFALDKTFFSEEIDPMPDDLLPLVEKEAGSNGIDEIRDELQAIGFPEPASLDQLLFDTQVYALADQKEDALLGVEGQVIPPLDDGDQNYLQWLAVASLADVRAGNIPGGTIPRAILYRLLSYRLLQSNGDNAVRSRIAALAELPVADLRLLLQEHLDCCTYRLDAWIGGLACKRLDELRQASPEGVHIGAWGYLENVRPKDSITHRGEYIPAPSLRHATAAAVLRSGFQANRASSTSEGEGLFAVNLSSARVKDALFLLEGVRNGQDLSALLGYRLERAMQEYTDAGGVPILAELIYDLRTKYPFKVETLVQSGESAPAEIEEDTSQRVINALDLLEDRADWQSGLTPAPTGAQADALEPLLDALDDNLDSVKDLLAAEGVYQLVDGQMDRAKAALDALTDGEQVTTPEIANIPRSSLPLTFRMGVMLPERGLPVTGGAPLSPRALVCSKVNRWLFDLLPDMSHVRVRVRWQTGEDDAGHPVYNEDSVLLRQLLVEPVDLVYMMHLQRENPDTSELRYRIERVIRQRHDLPLTQRIEILESDRTGLAAHEYTLFAIEPLAAGLGKMLLETRTLKPEDFLQANDENRDQADQLWEPDFLRRQLANVAHQMEENGEALANRLSSVKARLSSGAELDEIQLERDLRGLQETTFFYAGLGWVHAVPNQVEALSRLALEQEYRRADRIFQEASGKMDQAVELLAPGSSAKLSQLLNDHPAGDPQAAVDTLEQIVSLLYGRFFRVFPDFRLPNTDLIRTALQSAELQASKADFAIDRWLQTQAPVRPRMDLYYRNTMLAEMLGRTGEVKDLELVQLPLRDGSTGPWVGQPYGDFVPHADTLAMTVELQEGFDLNRTSFSGILIDEWQELVPDPTANTGIALQYDQPDMEAPNAVLLALTHANGVTWDWENLVQTVADTVLMAKKRAVDPDRLKESFWDQLFPGLLGPIFTGEETGDSLNFGSLPAEAMEESGSRGLTTGETTRKPTNLSDFGLRGLDLGNIMRPEDA